MNESLSLYQKYRLTQKNTFISSPKHTKKKSICKTAVLTKKKKRGKRECVCVSRHVY